MPPVLPQKLLDSILKIVNLVGRVPDGVDDQNDFNGRIGLNRDPIECVEGEDLAFLAVVQQREVFALKAGYGRA